jgi:hypothetical protein
MMLPSEKLLAYRSMLCLLAWVSFAGGVVDEQLSILYGGNGKVYDFFSPA